MTPTFDGTFEESCQCKCNQEFKKRVDHEFQMDHNENYWDLKESKGLFQPIAKRGISLAFMIPRALVGI